MSTCPFCRRVASDGVAGPVHAFPDGYPSARGHTLVVPTAHVDDLFDLPPAVLDAVWARLEKERARIVRDLAPDGLNVGVNVGAAAGQTVGHAHVHLIPRFEGDVPDPRGGVRWVLPATAAYWLP